MTKKYDDNELCIGILSRLKHLGPQEFSEFERRLPKDPLRRVIQHMLDTQLIRHHRPDGTAFHIEPKGEQVLDKLVELFKMTGWEEEVEDIMEAWA